MPSSSASMIAGSDPPSRNGVTYLVAMTVLKLILYREVSGKFLEKHCCITMKPCGVVEVSIVVCCRFMDEVHAASP
jgi:hypothetical protein